jgi:hypothetical protein
MKLFKIIFIPILVILLLVGSCTRDTSYVSLPEYKQKIVINGFISPDQTLNELLIFSTHKRFGDLSPIESLGNITLLFSDGTKEIRIDTTLVDSLFRGEKILLKNMTIIEGKNYDLKVISDKGLTAEASCTIPIKRDFKIEVDTISDKKIDQYNQRYSVLTAKISITDFPGESNYYRLLYIYQVFNRTVGNSKSIFLKNELASDGLVSPIYNPDEGDITYNDIGKDGEKINMRTIEFSPVYWDSPSYIKPDSSFLRIYLLNTDKPYYDFHQSLLNYSLGDTPFTEPSFLYSNVKGGVGIFASYTVDSLIFRLN